MISVSDLSVFLFATLMLNLTPGVDMIYVATRSTSQGITAGVISALGISAGCLVHTLAAVLGLSAIIAQSASAFTIIKYFGAAYLFYLGVKILLTKKKTSAPLLHRDKAGLLTVFKQGLITNVLNPKVALFFLAFLPQFVSAGSPNFGWQILFLGILFNISGTTVNIIVAVLFGKLGNKLSSNSKFQRVQEKLTAAILIALGIRIALLSKK